MSNVIFRQVKIFLHSILPIETILFIHFVFGHYYNMQCSKLVEVLAKLYCVVVSLIFPILSFLQPHYHIGFVVTNCLQFSMAIWASFFVEGKCFTQYCSAVELTDRAMGFARKTVENNRIYAVFFLVLFLRIILHIMNCPDPTRPVFYVYAFMHTSVDFSRMIRIFILDINYERMRLLRKSFENTFTNSMPLDDQIIKIRSNMDLYQQRLDDFQLINKRVQATFSVALVTCFIYAITQSRMAFIHYTQGPSELPNPLFELVFITSLICAPALFTELASNEVEKIRLVLALQLQRTTDDKLRAALSGGIRYLKLRPFQFQIWRVVPVDSSLLFSFINLLFTYIFVTLQLNHI